MANKFNLNDKVWIISEEMIGIIIDIKGHKYEVEYAYNEVYYDDNDMPAFMLTNFGRGMFMAYQLLPYTEGMELLYE